MSVDFKRKHKWTSSDEKVWDQLVSSSSARVLFADDPLYFKVCNSSVHSLTGPALLIARVIRRDNW